MGWLDFKERPRPQHTGQPPPAPQAGALPPPRPGAAPGLAGVSGFNLDHPAARWGFGYNPTGRQGAGLSRLSEFDALWGSCRDFWVATAPAAHRSDPARPQAGAALGLAGGSGFSLDHPSARWGFGFNPSHNQGGIPLGTSTQLRIGPRFPNTPAPAVRWSASHLESFGRASDLDPVSPASEGGFAGVVLVFQVLLVSPRPERHIATFAIQNKICY